MKEKEKIRVLFLDFDGVLNSVRSAIAFKSYKEHALDPVAVGMIRTLVEEHNLKIVISSTWRVLYSMEEFHSMFLTYHKWDTRNIIIDVTPYIPILKLRGYEIVSWLQNGMGKNYNVTDYIIIDDDSDMLSEQKEGGHFIKTDHANGFSFENFQQIQDRLK